MGENKRQIEFDIEDLKKQFPQIPESAIRRVCEDCLAEHKAQAKFLDFIYIFVKKETKATLLDINVGE